MISEEDEEELIASKKDILNVTENSVLGKFFGYFFDK